MKKFLMLYQSTMSSAEQVGSMGAEDKNKAMKMWMDWRDAHKKAIVDFGSPIGNGMQVTPDLTSQSKLMFGGYSIVQADSTEEVTEMLNDHPHLRMSGNSIEVFEFLPMPGSK